MTEFFRAIDTETTGPTSVPNDVVCELASVDLNWEPDTKIGQPMAARSTLIQIGIPMPPDARGIHHISDAELEKDGKSFLAGFKSVVSPYPYPEKIILVAHNAEYEFGTVRCDAGGKLLKDEIPSTVPIICTYKAALRLWPDAPNHKLQTLRYLLNLNIPEKLKGGLPHRALPDAVVNVILLIECLKLATAEQMIQWTKEYKLLPTCPIGKKQGWAGKKWSEVDPDKSGEPGGGFLRWMIDQPDMEADLKWLAKTELDRRNSLRHSEGREAYMNLVPKVVGMATSLFDLRQWFANEKGTRESLGIKEGTADYKDILRLCEAHKASLPQPAAPVAPPPADAPGPYSGPPGLSPDAHDNGPGPLADELDAAADPSEQQDDAA